MKTGQKSYAMCTSHLSRAKTLIRDTYLSWQPEIAVIDGDYKPSTWFEFETLQAWNCEATFHWKLHSRLASHDTLVNTRPTGKHMTHW